jgi:hypothetical protein
LPLGLFFPGFLEDGPWEARFSLSGRNGSRLVALVDDFPWDGVFFKIVFPFCFQSFRIVYLFSG